MNDDSPWLNLKGAAVYAGPNRSPRLLMREVKAGRLRAARIGGRGEYVLRREWIDLWIEASCTPVMVPIRRRA